MVWPHPRDVILYARSSYIYDNMFIICLSLTLFWFYNLFWYLIPKIAGTFAITLRFLTSRHHVFRLWFHAWSLLYVTSPQKQVTDVSLVLKDSDTESENLSSLIWHSVSDGQKIEFKHCILYRYIIKISIWWHVFERVSGLDSGIFLICVLLLFKHDCVAIYSN